MVAGGTTGGACTLMRALPRAGEVLDSALRRSRLRVRGWEGEHCWGAAWHEGYRWTFSSAMARENACGWGGTTMHGEVHEQRRHRCGSEGWRRGHGWRRNDPEDLTALHYA